MGLGNAIYGIISLAVVVVVFSAVFMTTVKTTNTTSWSAGEVALWGVVGLIGVAGVIFSVANAFGLA